MSLSGKKSACWARFQSARRPPRERMSRTKARLQSESAPMRRVAVKPWPVIAARLSGEPTAKATVAARPKRCQRKRLALVRARGMSIGAIVQHRERMIIDRLTVRRENAGGRIRLALTTANVVELRHRAAKIDMN